MTNSEAIETLRENYPDACYEQLREAVDKAIKALEYEEIIKAAPNIDSVKHGKWIYDKGLYRCTACNNLLTVAGWDIPEEQIYKSFKFCPNCGAQMKMYRSDSEKL